MESGVASVRLRASSHEAARKLARPPVRAEHCTTDTGRYSTAWARQYGVGWLGSVQTLDDRSDPCILNGPCHRASSSLAPPSAELLSSVAGSRAWEDVPNNAASSSRTAPPGNGEGPFSCESPPPYRTRIVRRASALLGDPASPPHHAAAMFAFSPDRHAVNPHASTDGAGRFVRRGVTQPSSQPGSQPYSVPSVPLTAPTEPGHERAYPQADGEP
jgi:hypothetical protein